MFRTGFLFVCSITLGALPVLAQTNLAHVVSTAGGVTTNQSYRAVATIGQGWTTGYSLSGGHLNQSGFLHPRAKQVASYTDTDGDGISDWDEQSGRDFNPRTPTLTGLWDSDGDGVSDNDEKDAGTNPLDPNSYFHIMTMNGGLDGQTFSWSAREGFTYRLLMASSIRELLDSPTPVATIIAMNGSGPWGETSCTASNFSHEINQFYAIEKQ